jgi:hypothetical protein
MKIFLEDCDLESLIRRIAVETIAEFQRGQDRLGKLAYPEPEAAALLSMEPWQLRDERRDGRIGASVGRGGKILYAKSDLLRYLESRRWQAKG